MVFDSARAAAELAARKATAKVSPIARIAVRRIGRPPRMGVGSELTWQSLPEIGSGRARKSGRRIGCPWRKTCLFRPPPRDSFRRLEPLHEPGGRFLVLLGRDRM